MSKHETWRNRMYRESVGGLRASRRENSCVNNTF